MTDAGSAPEPYGMLVHGPNSRLEAQGVIVYSTAPCCGVCVGSGGQARLIRCTLLCAAGQHTWLGAEAAPGHDEGSAGAAGGAAVCRAPAEADQEGAPAEELEGGEVTWVKECSGLWVKHATCKAEMVGGYATRDA